MDPQSPDPAKDTADAHTDEDAASLRPAVAELETGAYELWHRDKAPEPRPLNGNGRTAAGTSWGAAEDSPLHEYLVRSRRLARRSLTQHRLRLLRVELVVVVAVALIGGLIGGLIVLRQSVDNDRLAFRAAALEAQMETLAAQLARVTDERDRLVAGRHPGLHSLTLDENIAIEANYVRDIIFTQIGRDGEIRYEFRAVMQNDDVSRLPPQLSILLFDALGVQIGRTDLDPAAASGGGRLLDPQEIRIYHGEVAASLPGTPVYFRVITS